jgi:hypothetical protein
MAVRWLVYPSSQRPTQLVLDIAAVFTAQQDIIGTPPNKPNSDTVLKAVTPGLVELGYAIEVPVPVQYGVNGVAEKTFEVDAWNASLGAVIEVEAGIAVDARKIYQDLFEAIALPDVNFLCVAVQNAYHPARKTSPIDDFSRAKAIFDGLFASGRLALPVSTVMLLGY